jgi:hypothetical protein
MLTLLVALAGVVPAALGQAADPEAYGDGYQTGDYARIRYQEGGATILRADTGDYVDRQTASSLNAPVFPGDTVTTRISERVEVQLPNGMLVRLDRDTRMTFLSMSRPGAEIEDNTVLRLESGGARVWVRRAGSDNVRIDTPAASVYFLGGADVRIDVDRTGHTRVASHRGVAEVVGDGGSILLRAGMSTMIDAGMTPADPRAFSTFALDAFDRWCEDRDAAYQTRDRYPASPEESSYREQLPDEVSPYYGELSYYGHWVTVPTYGAVWYPSAVQVGWRPYFDGYWSYGPGGYFWVSYEPWGWAPYHYGRWCWVGSYGWCWVPGGVFAGAWVSWSWGTDYVGWCPLDFWGRPAYVNSVVYGYYDPGCWTFVDYDHLAVYNAGRYAVPFDHVGAALPAHAVVTRPPKIAPRQLVASANARRAAVGEALGDRPARMRPVSKAVTPERPFREFETRFKQTRRDVRPGVPSGSAPQRPGVPRPVAPKPSAGSVGDTRVNPTRQPRYLGESSVPGARGSSREPASVPTRGERGRSTDSTGAAKKKYDTSIWSPGHDSNRTRTTVPEPRRSTTESRGNDVSRPSVQPPSEAGASRDRVREMYDRMARPRETRQREQAPPTRALPTGRSQAPSRAAAERSQVPPRPSSSSVRPAPSPAPIPRAGTRPAPSPRAATPSPGPRQAQPSPKPKEKK